MKYISKIKICLVICIGIMCISGTCFAGTDQFRAFMSYDYETPESTKTAVNSAVNYAVWTFQKLGYINASGTNAITKTKSRSVVLSEWIEPAGQNYGFYVYAHGNQNLFAMENGNSSSCIYHSDLSGYWHFAFIDSCSCYATDAFAQALHTVRL